MTERSSPRGIDAVTDLLRRTFRKHRPPMTVWDILEPEPTPERPRTPQAGAVEAVVPPVREPAGV